MRKWTAHYELSHLDLQCLPIQLLLCLALYRLSLLSKTKPRSRLHMTLAVDGM